METIMSVLASIVPRLRFLTTKRFWFFLFTTLFAACGIVLFGPQGFLTRLHLESLPEGYGQWLGLAFLVSGIILCFFVITSVHAWNTRRKLYRGKDARRRIAALDEVSLGYLLALYETQGRAWTFDSADANINVLTHERMVRQCECGRRERYEGRVYFEFYLQHWVVSFLDKNTEAYEAFKRKLDSYDLSTDTILPDIPF